ncbi:hypothetical protein A4A49_11400 [Nicotiana attenuata]|uniref:Defensin-like protein 1 n=1 Tax=Nicotiana attenuata TaxID=49451 RepID=A0A1J6ING7_NICAT|nr:hypothetical protein A4A49_11400 [Nicotiana attenuata]
MAKSLPSYSTFLALLLCFLLISFNEMQVAEGKLCRWKSRNYSTRFCSFSEICSLACIGEYAKATKGQCIRKGWGRYCFCYRKC